MEQGLQDVKSDAKLSTSNPVGLLEEGTYLT